MHLIIPIALATILASCSDKGETTGGQQSLMEASKQELVVALQERDQLLKLVKEISISMDQIKHLENIMALTSLQQSENPAQRTQILADIRSLQQALQQRREKLAELEGRLQQSSRYTDELKSTVEVLRSQLNSQTEEIESLRNQLSNATKQISGLNNEVDSLNTTVATAHKDLDAAQTASLQLENELNTCYYVIAPKSQLKEHKIIETGFLRRSKLLKGDFDQGFFVIGDKRNLISINLQSNKVKLHTTHPEGSYEIHDVDSQKTLTILDPDKFWSLTNYLVIQID